MATIRVTRELLEYALDLPQGVTIEAIASAPVIVDGVVCIQLTVAGEDEPWAGDGLLALQYEETERGTSLVSAIPVT